jgi:hypothetical protein
MKERESSSSTPASENAARQEAPGFVPEFHGVRYQVKDVVRSVAFYTQHLGFKPGHQHLPAFATVSLGPLDLLLSGGKRRVPGRCPMATGKNREDGTASCFAWRTCPPTSSR